MDLEITRSATWAAKPNDADDSATAEYRHQLRELLRVEDEQRRAEKVRAETEAEVQRLEVREAAAELHRQRKAERGQQDGGGSWSEVDLTRYLDNPAQPEPSLLAREDGRCLLYPGETAWVFGEPGCGKTWLAAVACAQSIARAEHVVWLDFEGQGAAAVSRLLTLGQTPDDLRTYFHLVEPETAYVEAMRHEIDALTAHRPTVVVFDAANDVLTLQGGRLNDVDTIARFDTMLLLPFKRAGAAVIVIDHVAKNAESRGLWPVNSGHKKACATVAYSVSVRQQFRPDRDGASQVLVAKDRHGNAPVPQGDIAAFLVVRSGCFSLDTDLQLSQLAREMTTSGDHLEAIVDAVRNEPDEHSGNSLAMLLSNDSTDSVSTWRRRIREALADDHPRIVTDGRKLRLAPEKDDES